jgi:hypothetical protein
MHLETTKSHGLFQDYVESSAVCKYGWRWYNMAGTVANICSSCCYYCKLQSPCPQLQNHSKYLPFQEGKACVPASIINVV